MLELGKSQFKPRQLGVFGGLPAGFFKKPEEKPCRLRVIPELAFRDPQGHERVLRARLKLQCRASEWRQALVFVKPVRHPECELDRWDSLWMSCIISVGVGDETEHLGYLGETFLVGS